MAADPARHGFGGILREPDSRTESLRLDTAVEDVGALAASASGRQVVLVLRDPQRHEWERSFAARLLALCPGAVVVDVGYPDWRSEGAAGRLMTFGASTACLVAAAERLTGRP